MHAVATEIIDAGQEHLPEELASRCREVMPQLVPELIKILTDDELWEAEGRGAGWAPIHAAQLLTETDDDRAVEPLLDALRKVDVDDVIYSVIVLGMPKLGTRIIEPVRHLLDDDDDDDVMRSACLEILSRVKVHDDRIYRLLIDDFDDEPSGRAACNLAEYGDARAVPVLLEALDEDNRDGHLDDDDIIDIADSVEELGGTLSPKARAAVDYVRRYQASQMNRPPRSERPGRNDPCWCGSGAKYKKCHVETDAEADTEAELNAAEEAEWNDAMESLASQYNPDEPPDEADWLAMDEAERISACAAHHRTTGAPTGEDLQMHAMAHVIVENQLAERVASTVATLERFLKAGVKRHNAIHAIGSAVVQGMYDAVKEKKSATDSMERELAKLNPKDWL